MKSPAFQFYASDYLGSAKVQGMSLEAQGAYIRLLCYEWQDRGIPYELCKLAKLCGISTRKMSILWTTYLKDCFVPKPDDPTKLVNARLEAVRQTMAEHSAERSQAGSKGAAKRWQKDGKTDGSAMGFAMPFAISENSSPSPSPSITENTSSSSAFVQVSNPSAGAGAGAGTGNDDEWEKNYRERKREREERQVMSEQQLRERLEFLQRQAEELRKRANENGSR